MAISPQKVETLLKGNKTFSYLSFSMLLMRLKMLYTNDPSLSVLQKCTTEINGFLDKFKTAMGNDYAILESL